MESSKKNIKNRLREYMYKTCAVYKTVQKFEYSFELQTSAVYKIAQKYILRHAQFIKWFKQTVDNHQKKRFLPIKFEK